MTDILLPALVMMIFSEEDLIERIEKLQFERGGYDKPTGQSDATSAQDSTTQKSE